ncbi:MAG: UDP-N-acetylmuramoyl-L-alanyl-D-glutamate--2,6-diaminopimelate ligase, partial [Actinomycetales bacterium]|nr:UDP-N-acetylmuramoyl-L-alanyl-D-glutamate--2,6-diaminopimelate ligase [Actinomycetales bacterium]
MATELVTPTTLAELSQALKLDYSADVKVFGLSYDSRDVQPGDLYLAIPGLQHHGIEFLDQAISAGAVAVASDTQGCKIAQQHGLPTILLPNPRIDMAAIAAHLYGHPELKLRVIGVTGTNGKTTVTQMLRHLLSSVGNRVGVIGTLGTFIGDDQIPSARTTPESPDLFKLLAQMVAASVDTVCMEVSSHALELERVAGITFD